MAAVGASPSGFSYAQAAKGRSPAATSQAGSSEVTSGAATPAKDAFTELPSGGNWADDVEATVGQKTAEVQKPQQESGRSVSVKESAVERAKSEDKAHNATSGVSSPDLAASSSTTTKDDDSSTAQTNGSSSETTWETKSQNSEPAWIAERKERQSSSQNSESTVKPEKKSKETSLPPQPKPVVLHEAPPPPVNIWAKRAEELKTKAVTQPKPAPSPPAQNANATKENQRPRADSRRKANSVSSVPRPAESPFGTASEQRKPSSFQNKRGNEVRISNLQQAAKPAVEQATPTPASRTNGTRSSVPSITSAPPPSVKDAVSWPTPEIAQDKAGKDAPEAQSQSPDKTEEESTPTNKPRKKTEWTNFAVTPNIVFETKNVRGIDVPTNRSSGERRGGGSVRGRGGLRGGANGSNGGDRAAHRGSSFQSEDGAATAAPPRGRSELPDHEAMPPPAKPTRASSAGSRREQTSEARPERSVRQPSLTEVREFSQPEQQAPTEEQKAVSSWVEAQSNMPRTASPNKLEDASPETKTEEHLPEPIPRRSSAGTQTEANEPLAKLLRDEPPIRMVPSESRKDSRSFDVGREYNGSGSKRGAQRGGRGRGGSREFANGHQANHAYANGDFAGASPFAGVPPSPSSHHSSRGSHYTFPSNGRGGWRGNPRAHSIPDHYYGRNAYPYQQIQPVPMYYPGMYDQNGYPMPQMYQPMVEQQMILFTMVTAQLEYYFSIDNLLKDTYLRKNMDSQGFVLLDVVANFNRLKQLTQDRNILKVVCLQSDTIEIFAGDDGKDRLRRRDGYQQFVLEKEERELHAQNDGPQSLHKPEWPQMPHMGVPGRGSQSAMSPRYDRRPYDSSYPTMNGPPPQFGFPSVQEPAYGEIANGDDVRGRTAKSPVPEGTLSPNAQPPMDGEKDSEPDAFPDEQMGGLTVVVKVKDRVPYHNATTRTFSNGSIDSRSIFGELEKANTSSTPSTNGEPTLNGTDHSTASSRHLSPAGVRSPERHGPAPEMLVWWMKDQAAPSGSLPNEAISEPYTQLRLKALDQRNHAATGTCPYDLDVLYQFWCHFLIRNFNARMYGEFKYYSLDDAKTRHNASGLQQLVRFYDQALHSPNIIRDRVLKDYVELVTNEPAKLEGQAYKQLRSAWRNGALNLKNRKKLSDTLDDGLKARLDES